MRRDHVKALRRILNKLEHLKQEVQEKYISEELGFVCLDLLYIIGQATGGKRHTEETKQQVLDLYIDGVPLKKIKHLQDVSDEFIRRLANEKGLKRNNYPSNRKAAGELK